MTEPERGKEVRYLTQKDVVNVGLGLRDVLGLVRTALTEHGSKRYEMPAKTGIHPVKDAFFHAMPAWVPAAKACGIKWVECFPDNYKFKLPQTSGLMIINCPETGWPLCILDATWVTAKRTAAVSALACEFLARKDTDTIGIIGAGVQGREHVLMLPETLPGTKRIKLYDRSEDSVRKLIADLQPQVPKVELIKCASVEDVVRGSGVVVSATVILAKPAPQVRDEWIAPGATILPVDFDSFWEWKTFTRANKFLVDSLDEMKYFMTIGYLPNGLPPLHAEIGEVVAGHKPGRENPDELILDMNIGMGVADVVVGRQLYDQACERGLGRILPL